MPPADNMRAAKAMVYASAIHCSELMPAEKAWAMLGRAILTMETSNWETTNARLVVPTIYLNERFFTCLQSYGTNFKNHSFHCVVESEIDAYFSVHMKYTLLSLSILLSFSLFGQQS